MVVFPHAKINVGLHVLRKRSDGFHDIDTCFYPVPLTDVLEAIPSDRFTFNQTGLTVPGGANDNLCVKAYELLRGEYDSPPVNMHLHKIIPMGAGLGGGSSDGAFALKLLNSLFELNINDDQLSEMAAQLGSDCPFFISAKPSIGSGKGTVLSPAELDLKGIFIRIIHPAIHISTAEAYAGLQPRDNRIAVSELIRSPHSSWRKELVNNFCFNAYKKFPRLQAIEDELYRQGAFYATMSGSGSAIFGLFEKSPPPFQHSEYFSWTGELS